MSRTESNSDVMRGPALESLEPRLLLSASSNLFDFDAASFLGGSNTADAVRGAVIQSDGTVVLAANISDASPGGVTPVLLDSATASTSGAIVRLSSDGQTVLSVSRLADKVLDLSNDASGNLYVASYTDGFYKLNADASAVLWNKTAADLGFANVQRIDAGPTGYVAALGGGSLDSGTNLGGNVSIFDAAGTQLGAVSGGKWKNDVAIDEASQTVVFLGYRNATDGASGLPVQISYYRGVDYTGAVKYTGYDWSGDPSSPDYLNAPENNMADTRGYRAEIGDDGYLYLAFESAGGNNLFNQDPFDVMTNVALAGGDSFHVPYNTGANHITYFGRYDAGTGDYVVGNHILTRLGDGEGNTIRVQEGNIHADADGRVYVTGSSAWGLPLETHPANPGGTSFNPGVNGNYLGGAYLLVMDSTLGSREFTTRLVGDWGRAIDTRSIGGGSYQMVFGGDTDEELYILNAEQPTSGGGKDGWYGVVTDSDGDPANSAPTAAFTGTQIATGPGTVTLELDATGSTDPDSDPLTYIWHFGDDTRAEGAVVQHTFSVYANSTVTLTVLDDSTGWSQESLIIGPPDATFAMDPGAGTAPATISFDASATTDPSDDPATLTYHWDFGDGSTATGVTTNHTYQTGGIYEVILTVTDPVGATGIDTQTLGIARDGGYAIRLDFENTGGTHNWTEPGYLSADLVLYDPAVGYGYSYLDSNISTSGNWPDVSPRGLWADGHQFSKYPSDPELDTNYLVDVPNGDYTVLLRTAHRDGHTFPGVIAEGERVLGTVQSNTTHNTYRFNTTVTDGQLTLSPIRPYWTISGLEIIDIGPADQPDDTNSFVMDPNLGEAALEVGFDAAGHADDTGLSYQWDFGDMTNGSGVETSHTYATAGVYDVTLTVSGGAGNRIVDFGGDYGGGGSIDGVRSIKGIDLDSDGNDDDTITYIPLGLQPTGAMADVSADGARPSGRIFGGIAGRRIDDPNGSGSFSMGITNNGSSDYFNLRDQPGSPGVEHHGLLMWIKEDFLNGAHAQQVAFDASSSMTISLIRWENLDAGRFVVQDGDTFYVSQATFSGSGDHTIDPNATNWAVYTPEYSYGLNFDQDGAAFAPHTFTDIQSVGVLLERDAGATARVWYRVDGFEVDAAIAPVTGTVTVIDPLPRVTITATDPIANENGDTGEFTVTRTGPTTDPMDVLYVVSGTASDIDYVPTPLLTGQVTIPAGSATAGILITPSDDSIADGDETITLDIIHSPDYYANKPSQATVTIVDDEIAFVNFGGDYVSTSQALRPTEGNGVVSTGDFDGDGNSDDTMTRYTFSLVDPLSPAIGGSYNGPSAEFFGGVVAIAYDGTDSGFSTRNVGENGANDRVSLRYQKYPPLADFDTTWVWTADGFLDDATAKILGANTVFSIGFSRAESLGQMRWLLGDGVNFYVSEQTFYGDTTWTGQQVADSMWALYTPTATDIDFDASAATFDVPITDIPVLAAGYITDVDGDVGGARFWNEFQAFSVLEGDNVAPEIVSVERTPGEVTRPNKLDSLRVTFSEDLIANINASALSLFNETTGLPVDLSSALFSYDRGTLTAEWDLTPLNLPAGRYVATLDADALGDESGNALDGDGDGAAGGDYVSNLMVALDGDLDLDGTVAFREAATAVANLGLTGAVWADGDSNADGVIGLSDAVAALNNIDATINVTPPAALETSLAQSSVSPAPAYVPAATNAQTSGVDWSWLGQDSEDSEVDLLSLSVPIL